MTMAVLDIKELSAGYGGFSIVSGVTLSVSVGEVVAILGQNGSGKTTLMRAIVGILHHYAGGVYGGRVTFASEDVTSVPAYVRARKGLVFVPEGGQVFPSLSVSENLDLATDAARHTGRLGPSVEDVLHHFPDLSSNLKKKASALSTGERQMLAIARSFVLRPRVLVLDEPSAGLSMNYAYRLFRSLQTLTASREVAVVIVEQNIRIALEHSQRVYVLKHDGTLWSGTSLEALDNLNNHDLDMLAW